MHFVLPYGKLGGIEAVTFSRTNRLEHRGGTGPTGRGRGLSAGFAHRDVFYLLGAMLLAFISTPIDEFDPTKYSHQSRLDEDPLRTFFVSAAAPQLRSVGIASA